MKIQYLGTGAAEGIPAIFCGCDICEIARRRGGPDIRTRAQALIDDKLLIDFGPDTFLHGLRFGINYGSIGACLITHTHGDHLNRSDLICRKHNRALLPPGTPPLIVYGGTGAEQELQPDANGYITKDGNVRFQHITAYRPFYAAGYTVTPLPAVHSTLDPLVYVIDDSRSKLLYCHDSDVLSEDSLQYLQDQNVVLDLVSLDCTEGQKHIDYTGHMNFERDAEMRDLLLHRGIADDSTLFVASHFSHNGLVTHEQASTLAAGIGFTAAYDGLSLML